MELNDIIYNVLLLVGLFFSGFFGLGIFLSRSQRKAFKEKFEHSNNLYYNKVHPEDHNYYRSQQIQPNYTYRNSNNSGYYNF